MTGYDIVCDCGKIYDWKEHVPWIYYPRFDRLLCHNCVKQIHYRLSAEYVLKLVGEFNYRNWNSKDIFKYTKIIKEMLSMLHRGMLNNKSAIYALRQSLDTSKPISEIDISDIPNIDKVKRVDIINRGITDEQAKSLVSDKNVADFFEQIAPCSFILVNDFITYNIK